MSPLLSDKVKSLLWPLVTYWLLSLVSLGLFLFTITVYEGFNLEGILVFTGVTVIGIVLGQLAAVFRLPSDVGNEENTFLMQIKTILFAHHAYHARKRLRKIAEKNGDIVRQTIVSQSDSAYILELSDQVHRLIGVQK